MIKLEILSPLEIPQLIINQKNFSPFELDLTNLEAQVVFRKLAENWYPLPHGDKNTQEKFHFEKEITFFGGSFNPWHLGHNSCIELFPNKEQLIILPDHNPLKSEQHLSLWQNYLQILRLKKNYPGLHIYPGFWSNEKPNPTFPWIQSFHQELPQIKINLLMGYDSFMGLPRWYEYEKLLKLINKIYVVAREDDQDLFQQASTQYQKKWPSLKITHLGHHLYENLKSQELRKKNEQDQND